MDIKYNTVIKKNTFYFVNSKFEEEFDAKTLNNIRVLILNLKNNIENNGLKKDLFIDFIQNNDFGLKALLILNGISNETLKRIITIARIVKDKDLSKLLNISDWNLIDDNNDVQELTDKQIYSLIKNNTKFAEGIINLFFEGASNSFLSNTLPLFELNKLNLKKLRFNKDEMIDTLIRYNQKGSYSGRKENNPEIIIENIISELGLKYEKGDLPQLIEYENIKKRNIDFIIPNKQKPKIIIESSFLATTSSGQGDKSKTETNIKELIKKYYPDSQFYGFVDGIGWYVRKKDLIRMVESYDDVFTFHKDELERFKSTINNIFNIS